MSECYSHHIKLGLQRGAKLGLAASQTKTTWKNVRHYMSPAHSTCMDYCREKNDSIWPILTVTQLSEKGGGVSSKTVNVYVNRKCFTHLFLKLNI